MPIVIALAVACVVLLAALNGWRRGGLAPVLRLGCLVGGLVAGLWAARLLSPSLPPVGHVLLGLLFALVGIVAGGIVGRRLAAGVLPGRPVLADRVLGVAVRGAAALVVCGLLAALTVAYGPPALATAVRDSAPVPDSPADVPVAGDVWRAVGGLLDATAPSDLAALAPALTLTGPSSATIAAVDGTAGDAVLPVAVTRCGEDVVGTGFVAASGLVVTNAHVVAGAGTVRVGDAEASVVTFDRRADLAVLRVDGLDTAPLPLAAADAANGSALVIVGYPGGGPRTAVGATVIQRLPLPNPGLAGGAQLHQAYRLRAVIRHGNSGSPLLDAAGRVVGVVNALAGTGDSRGYAISVDELRPVLAAAAAATTTAGTGGCDSTS